MDVYTKQQRIAKLGSLMLEHLLESVWDRVCDGVLFTHHSRSEAITRGTVCVNRARTGLWGFWEGNLPVLPGRAEVREERRDGGTERQGSENIGMTWMIRMDAYSNNSVWEPTRAGLSSKSVIE